MPKAAKMAAPVMAPPARAKSEVVRDTPMAATRSSVGTLSPTSAMRTPRSDGRTRPISPVMASTTIGVRAPAKAKTMRLAASTVYAARMTQSTLRWPTRSPTTPNIGATRVPASCSTPNRVSITTDPVSTSTYQPRISVSISKAHEVSRSAGHWNRKLRTRNGASAGGPGCGPDSSGCA